MRVNLGSRRWAESALKGRFHAEVSALGRRLSTALLALMCKPSASSRSTVMAEEAEGVTQEGGKDGQKNTMKR